MRYPSIPVRKTISCENKTGSSRNMAAAACLLLRLQITLLTGRFWLIRVPANSKTFTMLKSASGFFAHALVIERSATNSLRAYQGMAGLNLE